MSAEHTLLLVDDEPEILDALRRALRGQGYRILTTTSPREALRLLDEGGVDLLLSDIDMPEMDGVELVSRTRRAHPRVARLLLTGDASLRSALHAINEGEVHRYLLKPWQRDELRAVIRDALERLDERRRDADADGRAAVRRRMLAALEREHPGISRIARQDGVHVIDGERVRRLVGEISWPTVRELFDAGADPASKAG